VSVSESGVSLKIPPHLKFVASLPSEISVS